MIVIDEEARQLGITPAERARRLDALPPTPPVEPLPPKADEVIVTLMGKVNEAISTGMQGDITRCCHYSGSS